MSHNRLALSACAAALFAALAGCSDAPTGSTLSRLSPQGRAPLADVSAAATTTLSNQAAPGLCLTANGTGAGATATLQSCDGGSTQGWRLSGGTGTIALASSGQCLDAFGGYLNVGDVIGLWGCHNGGNQTYTLSSAGELRLANGLCVAPKDDAATASTAIVLQTCSGSAAQRWTAGSGTPTTLAPSVGIPTGRFTGQLANAASGLCLTSSGSSAVTMLQSCAASATQTWSVPGSSTNSVMVSISNAQCLDAFGGESSAGDAVGTWTCHGARNQIFSLTSAGELKVSNGLCVGPRGGATSSGATLELQPCSGAATQKWSLPGATTAPAPAPMAAPPASAPAPVTPTSNPTTRFLGQLTNGAVASLCFTANGSTPSAGSLTSLQTCVSTNTNTQNWNVPGAGTNGALSLVSSAHCADAFGGYLLAGDNIGLWSCSPTENQNFTLTSAGELRITGRGLCLGPRGGSAVAGAAVELQSCNGSASQRWNAASTTTTVPATPITVPNNLTAIEPTLPTELHVPSDVAVTGRTWRVNPSSAQADIAAVLAGAEPGDEVLLPPGSVIPGSWFLPRRKGDGWITVRTDLPSSQMPAPGVRVTPAVAANFAKISGGAANDPVIWAQNGSGGWRFLAVEITQLPQYPVLNSLIALGWGDAPTMSEIPADFIFDRTYIHALPGNGDLTRCMLLNSARTAIVNSTMECHGHFSDAMAIGGWAGPGPYRIENNSIAGSGHGIIFGGNDPLVHNLLPSDIVIRNNRIWKPTEWKGVWPSKTLVEMKIARRLLIEGNVFENNWIDAQNGFAILLKSTNQNGRAPWSETSDVTFRRNIVRNVAAAVNIAAKPEENTAVPASRIKLENNLMYDVGSFLGLANGRMMQITGELKDLQIVNNTMLHNSAASHALATDADRSALASRIIVNNNIWTHGVWGWFGNYTGTRALEWMAGSSYQAAGNVFIGDGLTNLGPSRYTNASFAETLGAMGFSNPSGGDFTLSASSQYHTAGIGGSRPGADVSVVFAATAAARAMR